MKDFSKVSKWKDYEEITLARLSRIGLLGKIRKELIKENIIGEIELSEHDKEIVRESWLKSNEIKNANQLKEWKIKNLQADEDWEFAISREFKWTKWCIDKFKDEVQDYFLEKKTYLDKYIYSIIRVKSEGLSKELFLRIKNNESDFYSIAKEFSEGIENKTGGLIGPTSLKNPHPIISNILRESKDSQIWPPKKN